MPWFKRGDGLPVLVPDYMTDTIARVRRDGWVEVPDPRVMPTRDEPAPEAQPPTQAPMAAGGPIEPGTVVVISEPGPEKVVPLRKVKRG